MNVLRHIALLVSAGLSVVLLAAAGMAGEPPAGTATSASSGEVERAAVEPARDPAEAAAKQVPPVLGQAPESGK